MFRGRERARANAHHSLLLVMHIKLSPALWQSFLASRYKFSIKGFASEINFAPMPNSVGELKEKLYLTGDIQEPFAEAALYITRRTQKVLQHCASS